MIRNDLLADRKLKKNIPVWISFFLICISSDTYIFGTITNNPFEIIPRIAALLYFAIYGINYLSGYCIRGKKQSIVVCVIMVITLAISGYAAKDTFSRCFVKFLCIMIGYIVATQFAFQSFKQAFCKIVYVITCISLVVEVIAYIAPGFIKLFPIYEGTNIHNLLICGVFDRYLTTMTVRNTGIFWEPGVFQMYIVVAMIFDIFQDKDFNKKRFVIFAIGLLTTFSTTGYLALLVIMNVYILWKPESSRGRVSNFKAEIFLCIILVAGIILTSETLRSMVFGKILDSKDGSMNVRKASFLCSIEIFLDHPITGAGMNSIPSLMYDYSRANPFIYGFTSQNTNTVLYQFAAHGFVYGAFFIYGIFKFSKAVGLNKIGKIGIFATMFILYTGENLAVSFLPYLLIFFGLENADTKGKKVIRGQMMERDLL